MGEFVHLHLHSEYSLLDGACRIPKLIERVKALGQKAVAITDHGVMYGVIDFYKEAKRNGIKPIIGCEVYVAARSRFDKEFPADSKRYHLILLAENNTGYQNLMKLVSLGFTEGFYTKPRVDKELLRKHSEGLIALSACLGGEIPQALMVDDFEKALTVADEYQEIFGENNFFLELQDHNLVDQKRVNQGLLRIGRERGIPLVATNDCHYLEQKDSKMQKVLMCIQMCQTIYDEKSSVHFPEKEFYIKSTEQMESLFSEVPEAIANTAKIAERCNVEFMFGEMKLPSFKLPLETDKALYFREKCEAGLHKFYGESPSKQALERLEYEISVISKMGYIDYFLIVADFTNFARRQDIPVGPGRGSGAGSLCAYCLEITQIDPLQYGLLFERFLNPERVTMPDFDIDFCNERRGEVIDYVTRKYGEDHVAQIATFGTMLARGAIRDVGRAMDIPYSVCDMVAKAVPRSFGMTLDEAERDSKELRTLIESDEKIRELYEMAKEVEGMPRHTSTHAAGVVITKEPVFEYVPLCKNDESVITQFPMGTLEELGLLKMDFLGLRNLTILREAERLIQVRNPEFLVENCLLSDAGVYEMLSRADSTGVFQLESDGIRRVMEGLKPDRFEDLIALLSLYRPGPMDAIPRYIKYRHAPDEVTYLDPLLEPILHETYGCIVYQEQVMEVFRSLAGYSYGGADLVRRAMSKKQSEVMERERHTFIHGKMSEDGMVLIDGAVRRGVSARAANQIFEEMASFAAYAFNKSHAAAYALVSYRTAYLKHHYPKEFFAALISSVINWTEKMAEYIQEAEKTGIVVSPPNINRSFLKFTVSEAGIEFGLRGVKNLGSALIKEILIERETNGDFTSFYDFCARLVGKGLSKKAVEALIYSGAFDLFGNSRRSLVVHLENVIKLAESEARNRVSGQLSLFDDFSNDEGQSDPVIVPQMDEFPQNELLRLEKEGMGIYISGHPVEHFVPLLAGRKRDFFRDIITSKETGIYPDGAGITSLVIIEKVRKKITKRRDMMAFLTLSDETGTMQAIVFPKLYERMGSSFHEGDVILVKARISFEEEEEPKLIFEEMFSPEQAEKILPDSSKEVERAGSKVQKLPSLYLRISSQTAPIFAQVTELLQKSKGEVPVYLYFTDEKKLVLAPKKFFVTKEKSISDGLSALLSPENVVWKEKA